VQSLQFADSDPARGFVRGATWELGTAGGPLRAVFAPDGRGRWGPEHHAHVRERFGRTASWVLIGEDLPDPDNRVDLSPTLVDPAGTPAPRLQYCLGENTERLLRWHTERARESLDAAGARDIDVLHHKANGHFMGTARMGRDPATAVVDPFGIAHDVPNLAIVDGSVFVTGGSANPTSTIAAFALRAADHLVARRHDLPRPIFRRKFAVATRPIDASPLPRTVASPSRPLSDAERTVLRRCADALIPGADGMPSAASVGVADRLLDQVLRARPDLVLALREALGVLASDDERITAAAMSSTSSRSPMGVVRHVVAAAYYLDAGVRDALGYRPEPPTPVRALDFPAYLEEGLLDHLVGTASSDGASTTIGGDR
jgi:hypothetical protein